MTRLAHNFFLLLTEMVQCIYCLKHFATNKTIKQHHAKYCEILKMSTETTSRKRKVVDVVTLGNESMIENFVFVLTSDVQRHLIERTSNLSSIIVNKIQESVFTVREVREVAETNLDNISEDMFKKADEINRRLSRMNPELAKEVRDDIAVIQSKDIAFLDQEIEIQEILLTEMKRVRSSLTPEVTAVKMLFDIVDAELNRQRSVAISKRTVVIKED